ncbi:MAG TPA: hypothetical protein PLD20_13200 [Blastocatellia bacterium]|nr:hypothetical protein [Blastocatellia bacterium]HMX29432.1 hypothetical protein [Blastocatellia bacterium]HMY75197.1 hypothetical protein [Blastocatellia bacterium]HMZ18886.1 hypothetical protein [Blastocatellia bacterium]
MSERQMTFQNDLVLVDRAANGGESAMYEKYYKQLVHLAEHEGIPPEESADLARATLMEMQHERSAEEVVSEEMMMIHLMQRRRSLIAAYLSNRERGIRRHRARLIKQQHAKFIVDFQPSVFLLISGLVSFAVLQLLTSQESVIALGTFCFGILGMWTLAYLSKFSSLKKAMVSKGFESK